jgi:hypothetical protein
VSLSCHQYGRYTVSVSVVCVAVERVRYLHLAGAAVRGELSHVVRAAGLAFTRRYIAWHRSFRHGLTPADAHGEAKELDVGHGALGTLRVHPVHHVHEPTYQSHVNTLFRCLAGR